MSRPDVYHDAVRHALEKDGWTITHDPLTLSAGGRDIYVDLGAEQPLAAEKQGRKIAVEVKSFLGLSPVRDLEEAIGQFVFYRNLLQSHEPERRLYLAIRDTTFRGIFSEPVGQLGAGPPSDPAPDIHSWGRGHRAMGRAREYAAIIRRVIEHYAQFKPAYGDIDIETVFDDVTGHYALMYVGWNRKERVHGAIIHVDLRGDKVWIQHDGTEGGIAEDLMQAGIPREQIVLAFHSPEVRQHTGFAVA